MEDQFNITYLEKRKAMDALVHAIHEDDQTSVKGASDVVRNYERSERQLRDQVKATIGRAVPNAKTRDTDYIFLNFVLSHLPHGIIGLLLAVMFSAAMSSMAAELNALASTTSVDIYKRSFKPAASNAHYLNASRVFTIMWAILAMIFAMLATFAENLIQFVNIVGSLFYGTILGIFLTAFYVKYVKGTAVFWAAIVGEGIVLYCYRYTDVAYLLFNIIGCGSVMILAIVLQWVLPVSRIEKSV
jgi:Na+/proline symporter